MEIAYEAVNQGWIEMPAPLRNCVLQSGLPAPGLLVGPQGVEDIDQAHDAAGEGYGLAREAMGVDWARPPRARR